jgi:hypothetical protein
MANWNRGRNKMKMLRNSQPFAVSTLLLAAGLALPGMAQDWRYQPQGQQIPPAACLTFHFPWEGGYTPCTDKSHED